MAVRVYDLKNKITQKELMLKYDFNDDSIIKSEFGLEFKSDFNIKLDSRNLFVKNNLCLSIGSIKELNDFSTLIKNEIDRSLGDSLISSIDKFQNYNTKLFQLNNKELEFIEPKIMGILNVTPDSFSDGGKFVDIDSAFYHAKKMIEDGAGIIDVGGESTRPGADLISESEELKRVIPIIEKINSEFPDTIISIDTNKSGVADKALKAGAGIVNDISGGTFDKKMFDIVKQHDAAIIIMHIKGNPKDMQKNPAYYNVVDEIYSWLNERVIIAEQSGISKIILDPGIGFGKRVSDNFEIISRVSDFKSLGYPILIGLSKKSYIGKSLNLEVDEREVPTAISEAISLQNGTNIIRTHNVKNAVMAKKILKYYNNPEILNNVRNI
ncbi:MAG: dihydropteroate synthase [Melioribacteraceae bacterium]|nr:dihydropteroate synthase [Melioribacteraceae bacterium]